VFHKILIANRGEIAVRIIRACRELGVATVAVYSEPDRNSLHVRLADEAVCIGPASPTKSYLNQNAILTAAIQRKAEAIHPGFGFLSENADFAEKCETIGIKFIGPRSSVINDLGQKANAKLLMKKYGVPVIPGAEGTFLEASEALEAAKGVGFPVIIKAVSGGGGRGIRVIEEPSRFLEEFNAASQEAKNAFGDPSMYIEKFFRHPKHIEFQILADEHGHCIHLGERDCSSQRRKQKLIEETPSPVITAEQRQQLGGRLTRALEQIGYWNAGTVEFLYENGEFFFMEVNTRIQVEHPITEITTGIDLVKEQIHIAAGHELQIQQADIKMNWHAIECRINAEDPSKKFMPSAGKIEELHFPGGNGVRIDSAMYSGATISPYYDSMIAKLIVWDRRREDAIAKMLRCLDEIRVEGVKTNVEFQKTILQSIPFLKGDYSINFVEETLL
jgi:acetyl-CoA carboxylase biotin carboxylase subunit